MPIIKLLIKHCLYDPRFNQWVYACILFFMLNALLFAGLIYPQIAQYRALQEEVSDLQQQSIRMKALLDEEPLWKQRYEALPSVQEQGNTCVWRSDENKEEMTVAYPAIMHCLSSWVLEHDSVIEEITVYRSNKDIVLEVHHD